VALAREELYSVRNQSSNLESKHDTSNTLAASCPRDISDKYVPYGMHHSDTGYDTSDPELTPQQRDILEYSETWFNMPTQPQRHEPGANVEYHKNPALTRLHPLANSPAVARVKLMPGWVGPQDNVKLVPRM
jgi:hypothetical protein